MTNYRDADMIIENSEKKMIWETLKITSTSPARVKMTSLRELCRIGYRISKFRPELISQLRRNVFVVSNDLTASLGTCGW